MLISTLGAHVPRFGNWKKTFRSSTVIGNPSITHSHRFQSKNCCVSYYEGMSLGTSLSHIWSELHRQICKLYDSHPLVNIAFDCDLEFVLRATAPRTIDCTPHTITITFLNPALDLSLSWFHFLIAPQNIVGVAKGDISVQKGLRAPSKSDGTICDMAFSDLSRFEAD